MFIILPRIRNLLWKALIAFSIIGLVSASLLSYNFVKFARAEWIRNVMNEDDLMYFDNVTQRVQSTLQIPRIIHQTYKSTNIPEKWMQYQSSCNNSDVAGQYKLWIDEENMHFLETHYPWFLETYNGYPYNIQRADAIRYFLLYHYGGIYVDLDISCAKEIDQIRNVPAWIPKTEPIGFSNDAMGSCPKHPFFKQVIEALPSWNINLISNYPTVMISTGPLFLSIQAYIYDINQRKYSQNPKLDVLPIPVIL